MCNLWAQFLDDLRHADVLVHVVDCSGTTDEKGKVGVASVLGLVAT